MSGPGVEDFDRFQRWLQTQENGAGESTIDGGRELQGAVLDESAIGGEIFVGGSSEIAEENVMRVSDVHESGGTITTADQVNKAAETQNSVAKGSEMLQMFQLMMNENKRRDDVLTKLVMQLATNKNNNSEKVQDSGRNGNEHGDGVESYHIMPDLTKNIRTYNGESKGVAKEWLANIKSMQKLHRWPEQFALETARSHLVDGAKFWYQSYRTEITDFQSFTKEFERTFVGEVGITEKWTKMTARVQQKGESLNLYFHEKLKLCLDLGLNFAECKQRILVGLWDRTLCNVMLARLQHDPVELLHDLQEFEQISNERVNRIGTTKKEPSFVGATTKPFRRETERKAEAYTEKRTERTAGENRNARQARCYNCGDVSHMSWQCDKPRGQICYTCKKPSHISRDCPERVSVKVEKIRDTKINMIELPTKELESNTDDSNKFFKKVRLNEREPVSCFIDMGATVSIITEETANALGLQVEPNQIVLNGFGKSVVRTLGQTNAKVALDEVYLDNVKFHVIPNNIQERSVLLGQNFTEHMDIAYVRLNDNLYFGWKHKEPFCDLILPVNSRVVVKNDCTLNARSINFVEVEIDKQTFSVPVVNENNRVETLKRGVCISKMRDWKDEQSVQKAGELLEKPREPIKREQLTLGPRLSGKDVDDLLMLVNDYRDCFALNFEELGCTHLMKMKIVDSGVPVKSKPYRVTAENREKIAEIVSDWKKYGIATDTSSAYASSVVLITKKTGEPRLVVDYRKLNQQTEKDHFPLMNLDEQFENLAGNKIFSTLDLAHAFFQLPLDEESKEKTAFVTPDDSGQFERMCFGLANSPSNFARLITRALGPLRNKVAMAYLDDVLVPAKNWKNMLDRLQQVFEALRGARLTMKLSKCVFGADKVQFLGFNLSENGISPGENKVGAISSFPRPTNVREVKRFLGLTGFFRRFVRNYATIVRPISDLTRKEQTFTWSEGQQCAFEELKRLLTSEPVLQLFNPMARTELHTDASAAGLAGVLLQEGEDKKLHLVYAVSKKTTDVEANYHSSKLELMAIVWSIDRLRHLLLPIKFTVITDCQALVYLNVQKTTNAQIARWSYLLQEYNLDIKFRNGEKMSHVDALSRAPTDKEADTMEEIFAQRLEVFSIMTEEERILTLQQGDRKLCEIIEVLKKPKSNRTRLEAESIRSYKLVSGRLLREVSVNGKTRELYMIPKSMRKATVIKFHDQSGHFGVDRTVNLILNSYYFPGVRRYVKQHIRSCGECVLVKIPAGKQCGELHPIPLPKRPFIRIHLDHLGPFMTSARGNTHILVIMDAFTRFIRLFAVKNVKTVVTLRCLDEFVTEYGLPDVLISDRGTAFTSGKFEEFCTKNGIRHVLNSSRHPQGNGILERANRTITPVILTKMKSENKWDEDLKKVQRDINNVINKTTGVTPFQSLYGFKPNFHDGLLRKLATTSEEYEKPKVLQEEITERVPQEQMKYKERFDKNHYKHEGYNVGDIVYVKSPPVLTGKPTKTQRKFRGPYVVTEVLGKDTYRINTIEGTGVRAFTTTVHSSLMKIYKNHDSGDELENATSATTSEDEEFADSTMISGAEGRPAVTQYNKAVNKGYISATTAELNEDDRAGSQQQASNTQGRTAESAVASRRCKRAPTYLQDYIQ